MIIMMEEEEEGGGTTIIIRIMIMTTVVTKKKKMNGTRKIHPLTGGHMTGASFILWGRWKVAAVGYA